MHFTNIVRQHCNIIVDFMLLVALNRFDCLDCRQENLFVGTHSETEQFNLSFLRLLKVKYTQFSWYVGLIGILVFLSIDFCENISYCNKKMK